MRVWVSRGAGLEHLRLEQRETPRPGPGQVLLRMRAAAVNLRDHKMALGAYDDGEYDDAYYGDPQAMSAGPMDEYDPHAAGHERHYV